ncbi:MAG: hypothetical protein E7256_03595 [Lachnospiraceae bacterium]|nr:hypothetical protein [Lachnospiraceae bacterium]
MKKRSQLLAILSICSLLLCSCSNITAVKNNEESVAYSLDDRALMASNTQKEDKRDVSDEIEGMQKVLENDEIALYLGSNYDIAVLRKDNGQVLYSNPALHQVEKEVQDSYIDETKKLLFSQVDIEYYNTAQKMGTMSSYPDSYSADKNQVSVAVNEDSVVVTYGIGTSYDNTGLIPVFTGATFDGYDQTLQGLVKEKKISVIEYRAFKNNYTKLAYSEMSAEEQAEYKAKYETIEELDTIYVIKPNLTNKITNQLLSIYTLLGINDEVKKAEEEKLGEAVGSGVPAYFSIPLTYRLHGEDLVVSVDLKDIVCAEGYYLTKVNLLKSFGATTKKDEGYLFLPDGSGSIIENDRVAASMDKVSIPFYGQDYGKTYDTYQDIAIDSTLPVFGCKAGDLAMFGIVESGSAIGGAAAQITSNYLPYNIVYPYFEYVVADDFLREGVSYAFYDVVPDTTYAIRYHFLEGEDANYSGMARYYRGYLEQMGKLEKQSSDNCNLPLDIELIGTITKTKNYFGIPIESDYAVTDFTQANEIMTVLKENEIGNVSVLYAGMMNGGMAFKAASKVKVQSELGGSKGFKKLNQALDDMGYGLYPDVDFTRIYEKGNGVTKKEEVSKYLNKNTVYISKALPASGEKTYEGASYLINPLLYPEITSSFLKQYKKLGSDKLYVSSVGAYLNGNYSSSAGVTKETARVKTEELLAALCENGYKLKLDCGNAYTLPYASSLCNVKTSSSGQRIESYSIPFVGMVLKGMVPFTTSAINEEGNSEKAFLEAVESGAGLHYLLMYESQLTLVDTDYMNLFSVNYNLWMDKIIESYKRINSDLGFLSNTKIAKHIHLMDDVNCVVYEDNTKVYVNYSDDQVTVPDGIVESMSYMVVR